MFPMLSLAWLSVEHIWLRLYKIPNHKHLPNFFYAKPFFEDMVSPFPVDDLLTTVRCHFFYRKMALAECFFLKP